MVPFAANDAAFAAPDARALGLAQSPASFFESWEFSGSLTLVSDYRRAGTTKTGHKPAIQGHLALDAPGGWSAGVRASTTDPNKDADLDLSLYVSKSFAIGETDVSFGAIALVFPGADDSNFGMVQASVSHSIGPIDATLSVNYAWEQANLDNEDNIYVGLRARTPIGRLAGAPVTVSGSVGRSDGHLAIEDTRMDWSLGVVADLHGVDVGLTYVDTDIDDERGDPGLVLSIACSF